MFKQIFYLPIIIFLLISPALARATNSNFLIDNGKVFNVQDEETLIYELRKINQEKNIFLKILTFNALDVDLESFCQTVLDKQTDDEVVLIYEKASAKLNYCLYSKNNAITYDELNYIQNDIIQPNINVGHLSFALRVAAQEVGRAKTENITASGGRDYFEMEREQKLRTVVVWLLIGVLISWLAAFFGRTKSWWLGGMIGFLLGLFIWWISQIWFFIPLLLALGLVFDYLVSQHYKEYCACKRGAFWCIKKK